MDQVSAGEASRDTVRARRRRMRDEARSPLAFQTPVTDRYQTPEWLDRSFVLPLTHPEAGDVSSDSSRDVPNQTVRHHDDDPLRLPAADVIDQLTGLTPPTPPVPTIRSASFVRPASDDIDFARVIRRADLCRRATRLFWATTGLALLALVAFLLVGSTLVLAVVIACGLAALVSFGLRLRLTRAPIPRLQR